MLAQTEVDRQVVTAASAMGYPPVRRWFSVELPLAMPVIASGVRRRLGVIIVSRPSQRLATVAGRAVVFDNAVLSRPGAPRLTACTTCSVSQPS